MEGFAYKSRYQYLRQRQISSVTVKYCVCGGEDKGLRIFCESENYAKQWYHTECLNIKCNPKRKWISKGCREVVKMYTAYSDSE